MWIRGPIFLLSTGLGTSLWSNCLGYTSKSRIETMAWRNQKNPSIIRCEVYFDILNCVGMTRRVWQRGGQTDRLNNSKKCASLRYAESLNHKNKTNKTRMILNVNSARLICLFVHFCNYCLVILTNIKITWHYTQFITVVSAHHWWLFFVTNTFKSSKYISIIDNCSAIHNISLRTSN